MILENGAFVVVDDAFPPAQVIDYYANKGVVAKLHAEKSPPDVTSEIQKALGS